jgi:NADH-quinone oxidoreductase subunit J
MTTRPELRDLDRGVVAGVTAVVLFAVMAAVFAGAELGQPTGFPAEMSVMEGIGFAMFDISGQDIIVSEGFLAAFIIVAVVLDAALDGALMLAERDGGGE